MSDEDSDPVDHQREWFEAQRRLDEAMATVADTVPRLWFRIYANSQDAGFTKEESMHTLVAYILSTGTNGIDLK